MKKNKKKTKNRGDSISPRAWKLEPHHHVQFSAIPSTLKIIIAIWIYKCWQITYLWFEPVRMPFPCKFTVCFDDFILKKEKNHYQKTEKKWNYYGVHSLATIYEPSFPPWQMLTPIIHRQSSNFSYCSPLTLLLHHSSSILCLVIFCSDELNISDRKKKLIEYKNIRNNMGFVGEKKINAIKK